MQNVTLNITLDLENSDSLNKFNRIVELLGNTKTETKQQNTKRHSETETDIDKVIHYLKSKKENGAFIYSDLRRNAEKIGLKKKNIYAIVDQLIREKKADKLKIENPAAQPWAPKEQFFLKLSI